MVELKRMSAVLELRWLLVSEYCTPLHLLLIGILVSLSTLHAEHIFFLLHTGGSETFGNAST